MMTDHNHFSPSQLEEQQRAFIQEISSQPYFLNFADSVDNAAIFFKDTEGNILFGNRFLLRSLGISHHSDLLKFNDKDFFPDYLVEKFKHDDREVMTKRKPKQFIIELFKNKQGILGWFVTHKYPVFDAQQNVIGVMGSIQEYKAINAAAHQANGSILESSQYIQQHFREPISINQLAEMIDVPIRRYQRHFKQIFNISPQEYIIRHRLHFACEALRNSSSTIAKIAIDSGFYDQSSFTRQFKKYLYTTPLKYRNTLS